MPHEAGPRTKTAPSDPWATEQVLTNAHVVTADDDFQGTVVLREQAIAAVDRGRSHIPGATDFEGDLLVPGLVDLHTDNLESQARPRPGVYWDALSAALAHDGHIAGTGITTVFDSLVVGLRDEDTARRDLLDGLVEAVGTGTDNGLFRIEHFIHLRCEVTDPELFDRVEPLMEHPELRLLSVMEHTVGQRQFQDEQKYRDIMVGRFGKRVEDVERQISGDKEASRTFAGRYRAGLAELAHQFDLPLASHDDETVEHIEEAQRLGVTIAEFPTTLAAAGAAHDADMAVIAGAPNFVRGSSQTGNVSARELGDNKLIDIIASDYVPVSLLQAGLSLCDEGRPYTLSEAVATVTRNPAAAVGLKDRGVIAPGLRADLVRVRRFQGRYVVRSVWSSGRPVA